MQRLRFLLGRRSLRSWVAGIGLSISLAGGRAVGSPDALCQDMLTSCGPGSRAFARSGLYLGVPEERPGGVVRFSDVGEPIELPGELVRAATSSSPGVGVVGLVEVEVAGWWGLRGGTLRTGGRRLRYLCTAQYSLIC